jgi:hypothetical protein
LGTGKEAIKRYLLRFQRGIPILNKGSHRMGNGCTVHWPRITHDMTIYYCLCADHSLRGVCVHVTLYLLSHKIIEPPAKWSCVQLQSAGDRGRCSHFKAGSALVRDPEGGSRPQPSRHAVGKMAKSMLGASSLTLKLQAIVSSSGTINLENDSVRRYDQPKHQQRSGRGGKSVSTASASRGCQRKRGGRSPSRKGTRKRKAVSSDSHSMSGSASPPSQSRDVFMDRGTPGSAVHKRRRGKSLSDDDSEKAFDAPADDGDKRGRKGRRRGGRGMTDNGLHGEEAGSAAKHKSAPSSPTPASLARRQSVFASRAGLYMPLLEPHMKWPKADRQEYMMTLVATETCEEVSLAVKECLAGAKPDFAALREKLRAGLQE